MSNPDKHHVSSKDYYFDSYSHFGIHEEMLKDTVRTCSYRDAIYKNPHLFKGKVVLDIGCGTGILSMFAAKAGAQLVIGVDMSNMIDHAKQIISDNGFADKIILLKGKMEEVELPVEKVDVIISEWMGYFLLYESMFDTVIYARDRYLSESGIMFPDKAGMYLAAIEDAEYKEQKIHFWEDVYGFDMSEIKNLAIHEPLVDVVEATSVVTSACRFKELDLLKIQKSDLSFEASFEFQVQRNDFIHAFISYFDITFSACHKPIYFSTSPSSKYTHWKQTVFYLHDVLVAQAGDKITGKVQVAPSPKNPRDLDISIQYAFSGNEPSQDHLHYHMC